MYDAHDSSALNIYLGLKVIPLPDLVLGRASFLGGAPPTSLITAAPSEIHVRHPIYREAERARSVLSRDLKRETMTMPAKTCP